MSMDMSSVVPMAPLDLDMMVLNFHSMPLSLSFAFVEHCSFGIWYVNFAMFIYLRFSFSNIKLLSGTTMCCPMRMSPYVISATTVCLGGTVMSLFSLLIWYLAC